MSPCAHPRPLGAWDGPSIGKKRVRLVVRDWESALPTLSLSLRDSPESGNSKVEPGIPP